MLPPDALARIITHLLALPAETKSETATPTDGDCHGQGVRGGDSSQAGAPAGAPSRGTSVMGTPFMAAVTASQRAATAGDQATGGLDAPDTRHQSEGGPTWTREVDAEHALRGMHRAIELRFHTLLSVGDELTLQGLATELSMALFSSGNGTVHARGTLERSRSIEAELTEIGAGLLSFSASPGRAIEAAANIDDALDDLHRAVAIALATRAQQRAVIVVDCLDPHAAHVIFGLRRDRLTEMPVTWLALANAASTAALLCPPANALFNTHLIVRPQRESPFA